MARKLKRNSTSHQKLVLCGAGVCVTTRPRESSSGRSMPGSMGERRLGDPDVYPVAFGRRARKDRARRKNVQFLSAAAAAAAAVMARDKDRGAAASKFLRNNPTAIHHRRLSARMQLACSSICGWRQYVQARPAKIQMARSIRACMHAGEMN